MGYTTVEALRPGWWLEHLHPEDREAALAIVDRLLEEGQVAHEFRFRRKDGSYAWIHDERRLVRGRGWPAGRARRRLDGRHGPQAGRGGAGAAPGPVPPGRRRWNRSAGWPAGVAHDFNNMLGVILGHAELAQKKVDPAHPVSPHLEGIAQPGALGRPHAETARVRAEAGVAPMVLDLNETVAGMFEMLRRLIGEDIRVEWAPGRTSARVRIDPVQVDRFLANLVVNARDAIADTGRISIATGNVTLDRAFCAGRPGFVPGVYVSLAVEDDGCGMERRSWSTSSSPSSREGAGPGHRARAGTVYAS